MIDIAKPDIGYEEWRSIKDPIYEGWITQGKKVKKFENHFKKKQQVKHSVAVTNCTSALHLILIAMGIKKGDEIIVPSFTWVSTANVVLYTGAKVVFADIDSSTYNIDIDNIKSKITAKTKAIIIVHLFGLCVDIKLLKKNISSKIKIIEDCACAVGSKFRDNYAGTLGDAGAFSFHPRKIITTGEGGMITTNSDKLFLLLNQLRNHGASISEEERHQGPQPHILPDFNVLGYNYRMTDLQGAIGYIQLLKLDKLLKIRKKISNYYISNLGDISWINLPYIPKGAEHSWQAFVVKINPSKKYQRNKIMRKLFEKKIATRPGTHAVHMLNYYKKNYNLSSNDFPKSKECHNNTISLPIHSHLSLKDLKYIVDTIKLL